MSPDRRVGLLAALLVVGVVAGLALPGPDPAGPAPTGPTTVDRAGASFVLEVDRIEPCGLTCRNVTATLSNAGGTAATNVTVDTTLYADGEAVWNGTRAVGTIGANESATATQRVTVDVHEAQAIQENDGYVTMDVTVTWANGTARFERRRAVT